MKFFIFSVVSLFVTVALAIESQQVLTSTKFKKETVGSYKVPQSRALKRLQKQLAQVQNPSQMNDEDDDGYDDNTDIYVSYRRPELVDDTNSQDDTELSPYVTIRLALARAKALARYREIWS